MGMTSDDSVKQKLLDSLAEEPTMVISTAYAYAKNGNVNFSVFTKFCKIILTDKENENE